MGSALLCVLAASAEPGRLAARLLKLHGPPDHTISCACVWGHSVSALLTWDTRVRLFMVHEEQRKAVGETSVSAEV